MGVNRRLCAVPSIYSAIEQEYLFAFSHMTPDDLSQGNKNLLEGILAKYPYRHMGSEIATNVRLYFNAVGSLEGLAEWAEAIDMASDPTAKSFTSRTYLLVAPSGRRPC
jgi:hypothetical protein